MAEGDQPPNSESQQGLLHTTKRLLSQSESCIIMRARHGRRGKQNPENETQIQQRPTKAQDLDPGLRPQTSTSAIDIVPQTKETRPHAVDHKTLQGPFSVQGGQGPSAQDNTTNYVLTREVDRVYRKMPKAVASVLRTKTVARRIQPGGLIAGVPTPLGHHKDINTSQPCK